MTIIIKNSYNDDNDNENNSMQPNLFSNNASRGQADAHRIQDHHDLASAVTGDTHLLVDFMGPWGYPGIYNQC